MLKTTDPLSYCIGILNTSILSQRNLLLDFGSIELNLTIVIKAVQTSLFNFDYSEPRIPDIVRGTLLEF